MPIQSWGDVGRGALAGFIGGLAATAVMSAFMTLMGHVADFGSEDESGQDNSAGQEDAASPNDANQEDASVEEADRKSTRLNSSHVKISYAVFCLKKKKIIHSMSVIM